jgi:16S rRNA (guanine527-N7)-methyltransferase
LAVFPDLLRRGLEGIAELSPAQIGHLEAHYDLLVRWNRTLSLTSIDNLEDAVARHYVESIFLGKHVSGGGIVDVGSGAGFPGIPVAILLPQSQVTLVESHQRKAVFLRETTRKLPNVRVLPKRCEAVEERFDWAISRAVSYKDLSRCLPSLAPRVALLTGSESPPPSLPFVWETAIPLPGSQSRFLRVGRCFT